MGLYMHTRLHFWLLAQSFHRLNSFFYYDTLLIHSSSPSHAGRRTITTSRGILSRFMPLRSVTSAWQLDLGSTRMKPYSHTSHMSTLKADEVTSSTSQAACPPTQKGLEKSDPAAREPCIQAALTAYSSGGYSIRHLTSTHDLLYSTL